MAETNSKPTPPRSFNPSPKTVFLQSGTSVSAHRQMVDSQAFIRAKDAAIIEYSRYLVSQMPAVDAPNFVVASAAIANKLEGMHEFLTVMIGLSETPPPPTPRVVDNLGEQ